MQAHAAGLRDEVEREHAGEPDAVEQARALADELAARGAAAAPTDRLRALLAYAEKLTREPGNLGQADVGALRAAGLSDEAIHDAAQVVAYFNYINRIADGLGVDLEPEMDPRA